MFSFAGVFLALALPTQQLLLPPCCCCYTFPLTNYLLSLGLVLVLLVLELLCKQSLCREEMVVLCALAFTMTTTARYMSET